MMNGLEKSDPCEVARKPANKPGQPGAESVERRRGAEGNTGGPHTGRTQCRDSVPQGLDRVRQAANARKKERFTALFHHLSVDLLKEAYFWLKRGAAPGVDGLTWKEYEQDLEANVVDLHARLHRGVPSHSLSRHPIIRRKRRTPYSHAGAFEPIQRGAQAASAIAAQHRARCARRRSGLGLIDVGLLPYFRILRAPQFVGV